MKKVLLSVVVLSLVACAKGPAGPSGPAGATGPKGADGSPCTVAAATNGAIITCMGNSVLVLNGQDGEDGQDGTNGTNAPAFVLDTIDPCGDNPGKFDEILIKTSTGKLIAYFEDGGKRFLAEIAPGSYVTTDEQACHFTVNNDLTVTSN